MDETPTQAVILAAGRGIRRLDSDQSTPTPLVETPQGRAILDQQIESLLQAGVEDVLCLAGYHIEKLVKSHPEVDYYYYDDWEANGHIAGLTEYPDLLNGELILTTGEMLFDRGVTEQLSQCTADVGVAVTQFPSADAAKDAQRTLNRSELVTIDDGWITDINVDPNTSELPDARALDMMWLSDKGANQFQTALEAIESGNNRPTLSDILTRLLRDGVSVRAVETGEDASRYDESYSLAKYLLGTKADTLDQLQGLVTEAEILDQVVFDVATWEKKPEAVRTKIRSTFGDSEIAVRSSSVAEDGWQDSCAGSFHSVLHVDPSDDEELTSAITNVVESLREGSGQKHQDQVLIQPVVKNTQMSGVAFTRDLDSGGPYTVINFDDHTGRTDTITSGESVSHRTVYLHEQLDDAGRFEDEKLLRSVKRAIDELRELLNDPPLDIEFAVDGDDTVVILQVRPLSVHTGTERFDTRDVNDELASAIKTVEELQGNRPLVFGDRTVLGMMPDWNPAEMIGKEPDPLSVSLYRYLITDEIWAKARAESGYRDVRPAPLMVTIAGRPYIDTRVDFNSFLPASLPDDLGDKLVTHYVDRLANNPELHDKIEFDIVFPSLDFAFDDRADQLRTAGFTDQEIETFRTHLRTLTDRIVCGEIATIETQRARLIELGQRRQRLLSESPDSWSGEIRRVARLLEDTRDRGTLLFSILARYAFIATSFLRSLVSRGVFTESEHERFREGISTVAHRLTRDLNKMRNDEISEVEFFRRYGHLRPSTYDITTPRYDEAPSKYFDTSAEMLQSEPLTLDQQRSSIITDWEPTVSSEAEELFFSARNEIAQLIDEEGFTFTPEQLYDFIIHSIPLREVGKFEFTRNLSATLTILRSKADYYLGLAPEDLAYVPIETLLSPATENQSPVLKTEIERSINHRNKRHQIQRKICVPPVVRNGAELTSFEVNSKDPNFITDNSVTASAVRVDANNVDRHELAGQIALIPSADPGYDWIFGADIAGLVTKYGGVASHMAIRAAEFGLPAAIGCGEKKYSEVLSADVVELDCENSRLREVQ